MTTQTANEIAQLRISRSQFVRTYTEDEGRLIWSKVEHGSMRDLTRENSAGVLIDFHRLFVPHGERNPIEKIAEHQAAVRELVEGIDAIIKKSAIPLELIKQTGGQICEALGVDADEVVDPVGPVTKRDDAAWPIMRKDGIHDIHDNTLEMLTELIAKHRAPDAFETWAEGLIDE